MLRYEWNFVGCQGMEMSWNFGLFWPILFFASLNQFIILT